MDRLQTLSYPLVRYHLFFHGLFFLTFPVRALVDIHSMAYVTYFSSMGLGVTGWLLWWLSRQRRMLLWTMSAIYVWMAVVGLWAGNWLKMWGADAIFLFPVFCIGIGFWVEAYLRTVQMYARLLVFVWPIALVLILFGMQPASGGERLVGEAASFMTVRMVTPALLLIFFEKDFTRWQRRGVILGLGTIGLFGLITLSRGLAIYPIEAIVLYGLVQTRRRMSTMAISLLVAATLILAAVMVWTPRQVGGAGSGLRRRFRTADQTTGRKAEADALFEQLDKTEWVFGRGLGGSYDYRIPSMDEDQIYRGRHMAHFVHAHLILKGGLVLCSWMLIGVLAGLWSGVHVWSDPVVRSSVAGLVLFGIMSIGHTPFTGSILLPLGMAALGRTAAGRTTAALE